MSHEFVGRLAGSLVSAADDTGQLDREFEARLADSSNLVFRIAFSVLRQRQDAEDVAQDAFVRAHRAMGQLRDREAFRAWIVRMTWRMALDHRRGARRRMAREIATPLAPDPPESTEQSLIARQRAERLWKAIDALPDKLRIVIVLSAIDGHSVRDVAQLLAVPDGTVKSRLFEGRKQLQEMLR